jgi:5-methylthioadenosine/S-adenosylhomocysteine deaminase
VYRSARFHLFACRRVRSRHKFGTRCENRDIDGAQVIRYRARWVLPITSSPIEHGIVACENGVIRFVGSERDAPPGDDFELGDSVLLPGLVNAHTHLELTAMRGFLEGLAFEEWIDTLRRSRAAVLDDDALLDAARMGVLEGVEHGITTFADTSASGVTARAMRECGVRGIMYQEVFGPDPATCADAMAELDRRVTELRRDETDLVRIGVSPHAPYTVSDDLYRAVAKYAIANSLPIAMHIAESDAEQALVCRGSGIFAMWHAKRGIAVHPRARSPIALLADLNAMPSRSLLIHAVNSDVADIRTIVRMGACVAHCPTSNAKFGHGIAPLAAFLEAGIDVGLGSDSVASNNRMDMLDEARMAVLSANLRSRSPSALEAHRALELATIGGARALGTAHVAGSLEPGRSADLAAFRLDTSRANPSQDPEAALVFAMGGSRAFLVSVAGRHLVEHGELTMQPGALHGRVAASGRALHAWRSERLTGEPLAANRSNPLV